MAIFSAEFNKNRSSNADFVSNFLLLFFNFKSARKKKVEKVETTIKLQTWMVNNLKDLLHLKTKKINKYGYILAARLNYYQCYWIVWKFLLILLNEEKNIMQLNQ